MSDRGRLVHAVVWRGMGLPGKSVPVIVEPLKLPRPARAPGREISPRDPERTPAKPEPPVKEPAKT